MAFIADGFSPVGGQHAARKADALEGFAEYSYKSNDNQATIIAAGYFNDLRDDVKQGDVIHMSGNLVALNASAFNFTIIYFNVVPASPSTSNVTIKAEKIVAVIE